MIPFHSRLYVRRPSTYISSKLFLSPCHPGFDSLRREDATYEFLLLSHFINVIFSPLFSNIINALFFTFGFNYSPQSYFTSSGLRLQSCIRCDGITHFIQFKIPLMSLVLDSRFSTFVNRSARFDLEFS